MSAPDSIRLVLLGVVGNTVLAAVKLIAGIVGKMSLDEKIGQLRLIHGKGTGALRAGLTAYLSTNRFVKKLETAALEAGGSGATVIDL